MKVVTSDKCRFSYVSVFEPSQVNGEGASQYRCTVLIPKSDKSTLNKVVAAIKQAMQDGLATKFGGKMPAKWHNPLQDGDEKADTNPEYAGHYYLNAKNDRRPGVVDSSLNPIIDKDEFYSGCYGRASVSFFAFNNNSKGVGVSLGNLMKTKDGDPLGVAAATAAEDFGDFVDSDFTGNAVDDLDDLIG